MVVFLMRLFLRIIYLLFLYKNEKVNFQKVKKILIYGSMGIGNMILFTPTIKAIRKRFPKARVTLLVGNTGCEEVLKGSDLVDEIINFQMNQADIIGKLKFIRGIRKRRFDLLISNFHGANLSLLTILSSIPYKIGHVTSPGWRNKFDFVYNFKVRMAENENEIYRDLRLAYALGVKEDEVDKNPIIWIEKEDREYADNFLKQNGIHRKDLVIGVNPVTSLVWKWRWWSLDRYAELCDKLIEACKAKVILLAAPNEVDLMEYVAKNMEYESIIAAGKTTLKQTAALIEEAKLLICNDSGLMHVSSAVGTPVVAIYGPTDYTRTAPLGKKHTIIRKNLDCSPCFQLDGTERAENCPYDYKCLNYISVEGVFNVVTKKLENI